MWKELAKELWEDARTENPNPGVISKVEQSLELAFPKDLVEFYNETNGLRANAGTPVIWTVEELEEQNLSVQDINPERYMPLDHFLFIGDNGGGDLFGYGITASGEVGKYIFRWQHENDSRVMAASNLKQYLRLSASGSFF